ncbi:DUF6538 domain-containing protein [Bosea psychrotolerans]|uniref:DUF6538 domain-containing protein n=1 Tax=Bosea psychrotolerans TaxID=1871628 RepID=UPI003CCB812A
MARRPGRLLQRGNAWCLRVRVPDALRPGIRKGRSGSLKTSDGAEAKRRVRIERIKVEAEFDDPGATERRSCLHRRAGDYLRHDLRRRPSSSDSVKLRRSLPPPSIKKRPPCG